MVTAVFEVGAALLGACIGSFLNVVIYRVPAGRSLGGRSHCPRCGAAIRWFDNVPVFGWLLLAGKSRCCKQPIVFRYAFVELLTAALFWALLWWPVGPPLLVAEGPTQHLDVSAAVAFGLHAVFVALLVALTFIDFDTQLLPDALTKPGITIGLLSGLWPGLLPPLVSDPSVSRALGTLLAAVAGSVVGGGVTWLIRAGGSALFRKEAMGFGDVKLMAMIGAFVGWQGALLTMFLGCIAGAVVGVTLGITQSRKGEGLGLKIPFGPYLALGAVVTLFGRDPILHAIFVSWPEWQRRNPDAQWILLSVALASLFGLFFLVRRARRSG